MLETTAALVVISVVVLSLATIYKGVVDIMLRHNIEKDGFEIAQLEMANLEQSAYSVGESQRETARFRIQTKVTECVEMANVRKLEIVVYERGKNMPLVNLVRYE